MGVRLTNHQLGCVSGVNHAPSLLSGLWQPGLCLPQSQPRSMPRSCSLLRFLAQSRLVSSSISLIAV